MGMALLLIVGCARYPELVPNRDQVPVDDLDRYFSELAWLTGGEKYDANSAADVPKMIQKIIDDHAKRNGEIVFLIDKTGSMDDDIEHVRMALTDIIKSLPRKTRLGMASYGDNRSEPASWFYHQDLTDDFDVIQAFLDDIRPGGGGDTPESVYDAIYETVDVMSWTSTGNKLIIVIGDAPPHTEPSRTTYTQEQVIEKCVSAGLTVNLFPILIGN
ncbi:MAG: hypothetical protein OHK0039_38310 [Bacteroidia bacterium]